MKPFMQPNDLDMFYKYLDNATVFLEYGSGGSTYQATIRNNIGMVYSIESDKQWHDKLRCMITDSSKVSYIHRNINTLPDTWGHPGPNCNNTQKQNYSNFPVVNKDVDFVLIDGRFRVACCLKLFKSISYKCLIAFDDFIPRKQYHIVLQFYDIIEKTIDNNMVILRKKKDICDIPLEIITQYELVKD